MINKHIENIWLGLLWLSIFIFILIWDQEKVVVINLIVFCCFVYFLAGASIEDTLQQRRKALSIALSDEFNSQISTLTVAYQQSVQVNQLYQLLSLLITNKLHNTISLIFGRVIGNKTGNLSFVTTLNSIFYSLTLELENVKMLLLSSNLVVTSAVFIEERPAMNIETSARI